MPNGDPVEGAIVGFKEGDEVGASVSGCTVLGWELGETLGETLGLQLGAIEGEIDGAEVTG